MQFPKITLIALILIVFIGTTRAQLKGKSKHLPGIWVYEQGSGYEVWEVKNDKLVGSGYRTNKIGDTVRVEALSINLVNKYLYYTFETCEYQFSRMTPSNKRQFVSNRRKLDFMTTENKLPIRMKYSFGFFNKKKMTISIYMNESMKCTKLRLRKGVIA